MFKKYFYITIILVVAFVTANVIYNLYLNSFENFNFAYNYKGGLPEDVTNLNKILPSLTKDISIKEFNLILTEKEIPLNSVIQIDTSITFHSGEIRFQFSKDSLLQSIGIFGYDFTTYDSTKNIGSPYISYLFSNHNNIHPFVRMPQILSLLFISFFVLLGIISIAAFYLKRSQSLLLLVVSMFSFLLVIISSFFTLFFYFNYSFQVSPDEILFSHNYIKPQLFYEGIISISKFRSVLFDINVCSFLILFYLLYVFYRQVNKNALTKET